MEERKIILYLICHPNKGRRQSFSKHNLVGCLEVLLLPPGHLLPNLDVTGGDHVAGQGEEARGQAGLGQHPVLDLVEADRLVIPPPVPARYVQQVGLC